MIDRTKVREATRTTIATQTDATTEISKVGITTIAAFGVVVGLWSVVCIIGGMAASGGPLAFVGNWFKAVTGM